MIIIYFLYITISYIMLIFEVYFVVFFNKDDFGQRF